MYELIRRGCCVVSCACSGVWELTNQRWLFIWVAGLEEIGAECFRQKGNTMPKHRNHCLSSSAEKKNPVMHPQHFLLCCLAMSLHLCKSHRVPLSSSAVPWLAPCCCTGGPVILGHAPHPGHTRCQPQLAHLLSHSTHVVSIGHTPVPAVSACQPASLWAPDAFYAPSNCQGAITSPRRRGQFLHRNRTGFRHIQASRTQISCVAFNFSVYARRVSLLLSCVHAGVVCGFGCLRVLLGFHSPACCLPPFAIQMSMYEASNEAEAALSSTLFLVKDNHPSHLQVNSAISNALLHGNRWAGSVSSVWGDFQVAVSLESQCILYTLKLLTLAWSAVWLCGVTFMLPMMTPRHAAGHYVSECCAALVLSLLLARLNVLWPAAMFL